KNPCLVTRAAVLDLVMCVSGSALDSDDPELSALCDDTLRILSDSELLAPGGPGAVTGPGATQYLQSLGRLGASVCVEHPELWGAGSRGPQILGRLLQCPQYEVRRLALEAVLSRLEGAGATPPDLGPAHHTFTSMALHETHPPCLTKVLQVLSLLPWSSVLPWRDGTRALTNEEALTWLMTLTEASVHSVELHCAALALVSRLMVHLAETAPQSAGVAAVSVLHRWGALVSGSCSEEQPDEVKLTAAEVLVKATPTLLASPALPLGLSDTLALWRSLFTLLQDEDPDVRDRASDFTTTVKGELLHPKHTDVAPAALCPPVALELGVGLLCQLLQVWGQVPAGVLVLTEWLLGDAEPETGREDTPPLDECEEDFLFEKGELNLWAEPLQWARLLHRHVSALLRVPGGAAGGAVGGARAELDRLGGLAGDRARSSREGLHALPPLPQFSCTADHARLEVQRERAALALGVLESLNRDAPSH
ncbi:tRNA (32-2'-O)-methyltransferase regulator THADA-like, partial [Conger conger]|uniref:tRNA (32-2'-O)-methyltransferase regulator THADA-like n=1 Tax=Conger conger TaxID=82655 RepID=UPI002A5A7126